MMGKTRAGIGPVSVLTALTALAAVLATACTAQVSGQARPDPAVTLAPATPSEVESPSTTTRTTPTTSDAPGAPTPGRTVVCLLIRPLVSDATKTVNDYLDVANAATGVTPELEAAEQTATTDLTTSSDRLRRLPGIDSLPAGDPLTMEVPAIVTSIDSVVAAIPLRKAAPFNAAKNTYNDHLDAIRTACRN